MLIYDSDGEPHVCNLPTPLEKVTEILEGLIKDYAAYAADAFDDGANQECEIWRTARKDLQAALKLAKGE